MNDTTPVNASAVEDYRAFVEDVRKYGEFPDVLAEHVWGYITTHATPSDSTLREVLGEIEKLTMKEDDDSYSESSTKYLIGYNQAIADALPIITKRLEK